LILQKKGRALQKGEQVVTGASTEIAPFRNFDLFWRLSSGAEGGLKRCHVGKKEREKEKSEERKKKQPHIAKKKRGFKHHVTPKKSRGYLRYRRSRRGEDCSLGGLFPFTSEGGKGRHSVKEERKAKRLDLEHGKGRGWTICPLTQNRKKRPNCPTAPMVREKTLCYSHFQKN